MKPYFKIPRIVFAAGLLLITAHRLPAPIQEIPDSPSPTPTPTPTPAPSLQPSPPVSTTPGPPEAARFAGTWNGKIKFGKPDDIDFTIVVNSEATSLQQKSTTLGEFTHPVVVTGRTLSWQGGRAHNATWTLTPNPDGRTALVTSKTGAGVVNTAVFHRAEPVIEPALTAPARKHPGGRAKPNSG